ncbi:hypothetical protein GOP47_0026862 [Adiantum capillus-veneris]|nr:hypothetical protein GOP47_0026862 [Adiantum capillus-veneris]
MPALKEFQYANTLQIPRVEKVVVNGGIREGSQNAKVLEDTIKGMAIVIGQRANITHAKKAIVGFKIRQGVPIDIVVLDRLLNT